MGIIIVQKLTSAPCRATGLNPVPLPRPRWAPPLAELSLQPPPPSILGSGVVKQPPFSNSCPRHNQGSTTNVPEDLD